MPNLVASVILDWPEVDFDNFTSSMNSHCTSVSNFNTTEQWMDQLWMILQSFIGVLWLSNFFVGFSGVAEHRHRRTWRSSARRCRPYVSLSLLVIISLLTEYCKRPLFLDIWHHAEERASVVKPYIVHMESALFVTAIANAWSCRQVKSSVDSVAVVNDRSSRTARFTVAPEKSFFDGRCAR